MCAMFSLVVHDLFPLVAQKPSRHRGLLVMYEYVICSTNKMSRSYTKNDDDKITKCDAGGVD